MEPMESGLDPLRLTLLLEQSDWALVGGRAGVYNRLSAPDRAPGDVSSSVIIPLDTGAVDFNDTLRDALLDLQKNHQELWARVLSPRIRVAPTDAVQFRRESEAPSGLIPWRQGQALIESARATLAAGAKAYMEPARQYSNRFGTFANRYLDHVLMGQTGVGSYVVTALIPASAAIPLHGKGDDVLSPYDPDAAIGREVTAAVAQAVDATVDALAEYRRTASTAAFTANVRAGISFELVDALKKLVTGSDEAEVTIRWSQYNPSTLIDPAPRTEDTYSFRPADAAILNTASTELALREEVKRVSVQGRVHLLTKKEAGGPGVVGIDGGNRKYRVRLESDEDYHRAVRAHDSENLVEVSGELSREGTLSWLYRASLVGVLDTPNPFARQEPTLFD